MMHELKQIIEGAIAAEAKDLKAVLASVVALDGSSYRRPGVRMLILENGKHVGAVSGGCVEKEVALQAQSVIKTGRSKMMTYDGRYRLGCEGVLYILLEVVDLSATFKSAFLECLQTRSSITIRSYYQKEEGLFEGLGSQVVLNENVYPISECDASITGVAVFEQTLAPCFKLVIVGAEHDAVQLCQFAAATGWEVTVLAGISEAKSSSHFPGVTTFVTTTPEHFDLSTIDAQTAIVLMTHNFAYDLRYLVALHAVNASYIGVLGPARRRDAILTQLIEYCPDVSEAFLETIHGPAGLDIGSESPQEIALSICAEILAVTRGRQSLSLRQKQGAIHLKSNTL